MFVQLKLRIMLIALTSSCLLWAPLSQGAAPKPAPTPTALPVLPEAKIRDLLKPKSLQAVLDDRDIVTSANLGSEQAGSGQPPLRPYSIYAAMLVHASLGETRTILTDYRLYPKMTSYVQQADYDPHTQDLKIRGGIWRYLLVSTVHFEEKSDHWIHFLITGGHFKGLGGDIFFESAEENGTLVYLRGALSERQWPPAFIIERGAEIVFGFTARRMRTYIEAQKRIKPTGGAAHEGSIPQPRDHL